MFALLLTQQQQQQRPVKVFSNKASVKSQVDDVTLQYPYQHNSSFSLTVMSITGFLFHKAPCFAFGCKTP